MHVTDSVIFFFLPTSPPTVPCYHFPPRAFFHQLLSSISPHTTRPCFPLFFHHFPSSISPHTTQPFFPLFFPISELSLFPAQSRLISSDILLLSFNLVSTTYLHFWAFYIASVFKSFNKALTRYNSLPLSHTM